MSKKQNSKTDLNNKALESAPLDVFIGRAAMVGFVFAFGAYLVADIVSPGFI